jgi:adenylate kinase
MILVLMGPPGVGKGTQAARLEVDLAIPQISTGDLLRSARKDGSELGVKAASFMDSGALVPDALVVALIGRRLGSDDCAKGCILDGFPRTTAQAEALDTMLGERGKTVDRAVLLRVDEACVVNRILGRRTCSDCAAVFHITSHPPALEGVCDGCGGALLCRSDDNEEAITARLATYKANTAPVVGYYGARGVLREVDGSAPMDEVYAGLQEALKH